MITEIVRGMRRVRMMRLPGCVVLCCAVRMLPLSHMYTPDNVQPRG